MKSVVLVGLPGAGKTTIGRRLARRLGRFFHDTDQLIEERFEASIGEIFKTYGEHYFREREADLLCELMSLEGGHVIATGGGIIEGAANRSLIVNCGIGVHVQAQPFQVWKRLRSDARRPLLQVENPLAALERLHAERIDLYREVAALTIDAFGLPLSRVVADLATALERFTHESGEGEGSPSKVVLGSIKPA